VAQRLAAALAGRPSGDAEIDAAAAAIRARSGPVVVVLGRGSLAESTGPTVDAAAALAAVPGTRFLSALRRGNVHGALDLGLAPGFLPGRVSLEAGRAWFGRAWGTVPDTRGLDATGILRAAVEGRVRVLVLVGADPVADFPDRALAERALAAVDTVVAVDAFESASTRRADVFLPCTLWGEKAGTTTNLEGRVQRLGLKVSPEGTSMEEWRIAAELSARLGAELGLESVDDVTDEISALCAAHHGATADMLRRARDGVVLPTAEHLDEVVVRRGDMTILADDGSGASWDPIKVEGEAIGRAEVDEAEAEADAAAGAVVAEVPLPERHVWEAPASPGDVPARDAYALRLVSTRTLYDAGRAVTLTPSLAPLARRPALRVNPSDLARIGVADGADVRITSSRASVTTTVRADRWVPVGVGWLPFGADGAGAAELVDATSTVTDLRVETLR
jgi:NADH-quinone oxidoreductase subunit G